MRQTASPSADAAILLYLLFVLGLIGTVAAFAYWLAKPTMLTAVPYKPPVQRASLFLTVASVDVSQEEASIAAAREENLAQGLKEPAPTAEQQRPESAPAAKTASAPKSTVAAKPKRPPPKQVAKATRRTPTPEPRDAWAFSPFGTWFR